MIARYLPAKIDSKKKTVVANATASSSGACITCAKVSAAIQMGMPASSASKMYNPFPKKLLVMLMINGIDTKMSTAPQGNKF
jgi:hypothetical protein